MQLYNWYFIDIIVRDAAVLCGDDRKQLWFPFSVLLLRCRFLYLVNAGYGAKSCQPPSIHLAKLI